MLMLIPLSLFSAPNDYITLSFGGGVASEYIVGSVQNNYLYSWDINDHFGMGIGIPISVPFGVSFENNNYLMIGVTSTVGLLFTAKINEENVFNFIIPTLGITASLGPRITGFGFSTAADFSYAYISRAGVGVTVGIYGSASFGLGLPVPFSVLGYVGAIFRT